MVNTYDIITERMIKALESGVAPWRKPWNDALAPRNISGRRYRGINPFLLPTENYASPFWLTYNQAKALGGNVLKGETSHLVVLWKPSKGKDKVTGDETTFLLLRYFRVFNVEQTEGCAFPKAVRDFDPTPNVHDPIEAAEGIWNNYPKRPWLNFGSAAFYVPALDQITVPEMGQYEVREEYYSTLFHEMGHSTGHKSRLDRNIMNSFGTHSYGQEELVAEMTATFLCSRAGIEVTFDNSAAYLNSWINTIKGNSKMVVAAAGAASKAVDYILDEKPEYESEPNTEPELASV